MTPRKRPIPRRLLAVTAAASLVLVSACSDDDAGAPPATDAVDTTESGTIASGTIESGTTDAPSVTTSATTDPTTTSGPTTSTTDTSTTDTSTTDTSTTTEPDDTDDPDGPRFDILEPRVGTWVVGDAGEIDVDLTPDGLVLLDVRAEPGWAVSVDESSPDEIEVDFEQGAVEWEIEIEWEDGILEIEIDQDIEPAEPGMIEVGIAGTVEFERGPAGLVLIGVTTTDGWDAAVTEEDADEIEVRFVNGLAEYEVEIELELDDGIIEVEVDFEVEGPFAP